MVALAGERWQKTGNDGEYGIFVYGDATLKIKSVPGFSESGQLDRRHEIRAILEVTSLGSVVCENRAAFAEHMDDLRLPLYLDSPAEQQEAA